LDDEAAEGEENEVAMKLTSQIKPGAKIDLKGADITLNAPLKIPAGKPVEIFNGTLRYKGGSGKVGDPKLSVFNVGKGATLIAHDLYVDVDSKRGIAHVDGGSATLEDIIHTAGHCVWAAGFDHVSIKRVWPKNAPEKYWFCNFTNLGKVLRIDNSGCPHRIPGGQHEAIIRLMSIDDSEIVGVQTESSHAKQDFQDRPAGKPGDVFTRHLWRNCVCCSVDVGNFKLRTDKNFPFGKLKLSRWENCDIGHFATTAQGDKPLTKREMGVERTEIVNTKIGGKKVNKTTTY
jgi:hypothetical protein